MLFYLLTNFVTEITWTYLTNKPRKSKDCIIFNADNSKDMSILIKSTNLNNKLKLTLMPNIFSDYMNLRSICYFYSVWKSYESLIHVSA